MMRGLRRRVLAVALCGLIAAVVSPSNAGAEQRVTELASTDASARQVQCELDEFGGCPLAVTPDGRSVFFVSRRQYGLYRSTRGVTTLMSIGPDGKPIGFSGCNRYVFCEIDASDDGNVVAFRCDYPSTWAGLCLRSPNTTKLVATSSRPDPDGSVVPRVVDLSADGSHLFYGFQFGGPPVFRCAACTSFYEYDGTSTQTFFGDEQRSSVLDKGKSSDGKRFFFATTASLVPEDTDSCVFDGYYGAQDCWDVYEHTADGRFVLISTGPSADNGPFDASAVDLTPDGSHVLFTTRERLTPDDTDSELDLYERVGEETKLVRLPRHVVPYAHVSDDGSRLVFQTAESLVPEDTDRCKLWWESEIRGCYDVYELHDGQLTLVSTGSVNANGSFEAELPGGYSPRRVMSADGTHVFFQTTGALVSSDTDSCPDLGIGSGGCPDVYERSGGVTKLVSTSPSAPNGNYEARFIDSSADGRRVFFRTGEPLVAADRDACGSGRGCPDIYERFAGTTTLVSTGPTDPQAGDCEDDFLPTCPKFIGQSDDGTLAYFVDYDPLVSADTDGLPDMYASGALTRQCRPKQHGATPKDCWAGRKR
jgi:hypothetical protein